MKRTELKKGKPLRADPGKVKAWVQSCRKRLPQRNPKRLARLRAKQFGVDGKREWVVGMGCFISGSSGTRDNPVDPAHIGKTRGAGADSTRILGLLRFPYHDDYDNLPRAKFEAKHGVRHAELENRARWAEEEWQRKQAAR